MKKEHIWVETENKTPFRLNAKNIKVNLSKKNLLIFNHFYGLLADYWKDKREDKTPFNEIFFHKVLSELIRNDEKLNFITRGWYLYGIEIAKPLDLQSHDLPSIQELTGGTGFPEEYIKDKDNQILSVAEEFNPNECAFFWEEKQYEKYGEKVYQSKLKLQKALSGGKATDISKALSTLNLYLTSHKYQISTGADALSSFVDIANKVIISNNYHIPSFKHIKEAFEASWKCFATVNLHLTKEGIDADQIQALNHYRINKLNSEAKKTTRQLMKDINVKQTKIKLKSEKFNKEILSMISRISKNE